MAIANGYTTLVIAKSADVLSITDSNSDTNLEAIIEACSRAIDNHCGRRFFVASETRYYTAESAWRLDVDDVSDVAASASFALYTDDDGDGTFENTWAATDFAAAPINAALNGFPYTALETTPQGEHRFPHTRNGVKVVAPFGFAAVPKPVVQACNLLTAREYRRLKAVFGVAGASAVGQVYMSIPKFDPDVLMLLAPYVRLV